MIPIKSELLFTLTAKVSAPHEVGTGPWGRRRVFPIDGGEFEGTKLRGIVLPGGADWMIMRADGVAVIDVRVTLQTDDGDLILMNYGGFRHGPKDVMDRLARGEYPDPSEYYFRVAVMFETSSEKYAWLNKIVAVGTGNRTATGPVYYIHEIL